MVRLTVSDGPSSAIATIVAKLSSSISSIQSGETLSLEGSKSSDLFDIVSQLNDGSTFALVPKKLENELKDVINEALKVEASGNDKQLQDYSKRLNKLLAETTFVVGYELSCADIAVFVCIYDFFSNLKEESLKYVELSNLTRWFDTIQHQLDSLGALDEQYALVSIDARAFYEKLEKQNAKKKKGKNKGSNKEAKEEEKEEKKDGKKGKKKAKKNAVAFSDNVDLEFIQHRIARFDEIYDRQQAERESLQKPIKVTLPDGKEFDATAFKDSPMDIANNLSKSLAKSAIVARVNGVLWDLLRPFEEDCKLEILKFDDEDGKHVFWHSSSHVLGQSLERLFKGKLTVGPALDPSQMMHNGGFYYDVDTSDLGENQTISQAHYEQMEKFIKKEIVSAKQPFKRVVLSKDEALDMFKFNKFKQELISEKIQDGTVCTAYRCGPLIDLCRGPHIPNTSIIKAMQIVKNGATYWKNDNERESLQRIYGISFPSAKEMKEYHELKKRCEESDHRHIGEKQNLFFFNDLSPGSCFWLPHGARVYTKLQEFMRKCYYQRGFTEVVSPNVFKFTLWETSGHAANYKDNMFLFDVEGQDFGLKPMNCPGHCLMFKHELRSYRDLPIRFADFGVLHRNELSGSLTGLTRVRRFCQDDAHIFCRADQIEEEIMNALDFLKYVYNVFDFEFELELSTRPLDKFLGDVKVWDLAEAQLKSCLDDFVKDPDNRVKAWKLNPGDGAFYGPKIDIKVFDSLRREHQCATIQLDFQLPIRFDLNYQGKDKVQERPVIIHRAIYGSFERFIAILIEHLGGKWPFWLSPRQICIVPITKEHFEYASEVKKQIEAAGYYVDADLSNNRQQKKIRNAEIHQYNFILVVGKDEMETKTVNIRTRDNKIHGKKSIEETLAWFKDLVDKYE